MVFVKKEMVSDNMRFYVEGDICHLDDVLLFLDSEIKKYDWVFTDMEAHVFKKSEEIEEEDGADTIFEKGYLYITGEELYDFSKKYGVLIIFGVVIAVEKINTNVLKNPPCAPIIQDNERYWERDYFLTIPDSVIEFGFFDTTCLIFASNNESITQKFKNQFPTAILYSDYLELE
ncbi:hypothetical protein ACFC3Y_13055 [Bacillus wiedmannii]|uniref:hypothetical protein n=2 Tax=Bacillus TaxID=1386 RepID=UPI00205DE84F|nr:hypothetical protein BTI679_11220 [Bacillus wiedmannii]